MNILVPKNNLNYVPILISMCSVVNLSLIAPLWLLTLLYAEQWFQILLFLLHLITHCTSWHLHSIYEVINIKDYEVNVISFPFERYSGKKLFLSFFHILLSSSSC